MGMGSTSVAANQAASMLPIAEPPQCRGGAPGGGGGPGPIPPQVSVHFPVGWDVMAHGGAASLNHGLVTFNAEVSAAVTELSDQSQAMVGRVIGAETTQQGLIGAASSALLATA